MSRRQGMHPAWVDGISLQSLPARYACGGEVAYLPVCSWGDGEVAYLPACSWGDGGLECQESAVFQDTAGDEANTTAVVKAPPRMQNTPSAESRAMGVIKNLPSRCKEEQVLDVISKLGFGSDITAFIMPTRGGKGNRKLNKGFAFVYFSDERVCWQFVKAAAGYRGFGEHHSGRAISVTFSLHFGGSPRVKSSEGSSEETEDELKEAYCL